MLPDFISFRKPLEQRKKEYEQFFSCQETCNNIDKFWAFDLELAIDNNVRWHALWQMSEENCKLFRTLFPTTVVVRVQEIIFEELSAIVVVERVQDDLEFPEMLTVPLLELFPIKKQSKAPFSVVRNIADWLDRCRFFFLYLWYPWDSSESTPLCEWAEKHLLNRLRLQNDIRSGIVDKATAHYIQSLITEAVQVFDITEDVDDGEPTDAKKILIVKNLVRKENIKLELGFFEVPELRAAMVEYTRGKKRLQSDECISMVAMQGSLSELATFVSKAKNVVPATAKVNLSHDAENALQSAQGCLILSPGKYEIGGLGNLAYGGQIKGVGDHPSDTVISPRLGLSSHRFMFLSCLGSVHLENVTIERLEGVLVCVSESSLTMKCCHLIGTPGCLARGVVIQPGCKLEMIDCSISNLGTGIIAKTNSSLLIHSTTITNCSEGIKVMDGVTATLCDASVTSCSVAGFVLETLVKRENASGPIATLLEVPTISINDSRFESNEVDASIISLSQEPFSEN